MKACFVAMLLAGFAFAQSSPTVPWSACGAPEVSFGVKLDDTQHAPAQPDPDKARVYFIHDAGTGASVWYPTVKVALDGAWMGANHGNSYFSVPVDPGEHHVCVTLQSSLVAPRVELAHFTAAAGSVYYYRTRLILSRSVELLELVPIDSDQGKYLIDSFRLSVSNPKK